MTSLVTSAARSRFLKSRFLFSRSLASSSQKEPTSRPSSKYPEKLNYNTSISFGDTPEREHLEYPLVTAKDLQKCHEPPTRVKLLVRDFIDDSLYNPHYGYFPQQATIVSPAEGSFNFTALRDSVQFQEEVAKRYGQYKQEGFEGPGRQLWHTPTELFKVKPQMYFRSVTDQRLSALVRSSNRKVPCIRIFAQILSVRGLHHL
jgi:hypothetical protein